MNSNEIGGMIEIGKELVKMHPYGQAASIGEKILKNKWTWIGGGTLTAIGIGGAIYLVNKYDLIGNFEDGVADFKEDTKAVISEATENIKDNYLSGVDTWNKSAKKIEDTFKSSSSHVSKRASKATQTVKTIITKTASKIKTSLPKW